MTDATSTCRYCNRTPTDGSDVCRQHKDLVGYYDQIAICTRDEHCVAPADGHEADCPIEAELKRTFGY